MVGVEGVNLYVKQPVYPGVYHVGGLGLVIPAPFRKDTFPGHASVRGAENILGTALAAHGTTECTGDQMFGILQVNRHRHVTETALLVRFVRCDISPFVSGDVIFPYTSVSHGLRAGIRAVSDIHTPVR